VAEPIPFDMVQRALRAPGGDPVASTVARLRQQDVGATLRRLPDPQAAARVNRLSRETQLPPAQVEGREDEIEQSRRAATFSDFLSTSTAMTRWAAANPRGAAAAQDDTESLGLLGGAWDFVKNAPGRVVGAGGWGLSGMLSGTFTGLEELNDIAMTPLWAGMSAVSQASGLEFLEPERALEARQRQRSASTTYFREGTERAREANRGANWITEGLLSGVESVPLTLGAIATRNPTAASAVMGTVVGGGEYARAREAGLDPATAFRFGVTQGSIEGVTELIPAGTLVDLISRKTPWGKAFIRELGQEMTGEQVATALQDMTDWAFLPENREKTFGDYLSERPDAALSTALAVVGGTGSTVAGIGAAQRATDATIRVADRIGQARQARAERQFIDRAEKAAEGSKLRQRDPEAFRALLQQQAEEAGATSVFIPGDAIRAYQQSDSYDELNDPFGAYNVDEAAGAGGDVVIPIADALTDFVGTPAWKALKDDMRLAPGGMSSREAETFNEAMDDLMAEMGDQSARIDAVEAEQRTVREKIVDRVAEMFGESFTSPVARQIAELFAQRMQARASRLGQEVSEADLDGFGVRQVMPEGVAEAVKADKLDLVVNAMRQGKPVTSGVGSSLLEFIAGRGGINDTGGDLASMGVPAKLLRDTAQGELAGGLSGAGDFGIDTTLRAAIEAGFFPELANVENEAGPSTLDTNVLLAALAEEAAGRPVYAETRDDPMRAAAEDLRAMLEQSGLNPDEMSDAEVRAAVEGMASGAQEGRAFEQLPDTLKIDGVQRPTRNSEGQPIAGSEEGVRAFYKWFGDSKVVDADGRPLVVFHGGLKGLEKFESTNWRYREYMMPENRDKQVNANFFSKDRATAQSYKAKYDRGEAWDRDAEGAMYEVYLNIAAPHTIDMGGKKYHPQQVEGQIDEARKADADGMIVENIVDDRSQKGKPTTVYVPFTAEQIKTTQNRGTFDPSDPRILYQAAEDALADEQRALLAEHRKASAAVQQKVLAETKGSPREVEEAITAALLTARDTDPEWMQRVARIQAISDQRAVIIARLPQVAVPSEPEGPALIGFEDAPRGYSSPSVNWGARDLMHQGSAASALKSYGRGKGIAYEAWVPLDDIPKPRGAGITKEGYPGRGAYDWDELNSRGEPPAATVIVNKSGKITIADGNHRIAFWREQGHDYVPAFVIDEREGAADLDFRAYEQEARGRIIFDQNARIIELFQSRNLSTPLHELSHMWLEELRFDAEHPGAPEQLKADWETVKAYFAANGHKIGKDGQIPTEAHELWARSGERYLMEGKAPSSALTRLFEAFRGWLVNIYKTVEKLRAPITPEIREVFDRLLATDEEIAAAQERQGIAALFKDAASIGMTEPEFDAYQRQVDDARAGAHASLLDKTMKAIRRRETERYREARKAVRAEEQERIDAAPVFKALSTMKDNRVSKEWIADEMGLDALDLLPVRVPPLYVAGGAHPDVVAEQSGYASGKAMIEALIGAERAHRQAKEGGDKRPMRERAIDTAADAEMNRRWGDPLNDGSIEREALAAVHSEMQGEVIASEIRVLSRKTGQRPTPYALAREWARGKIRTGTVAMEASPSAIQRHARNAAKAGREAEQAMLKGDVEATFRFKQQQMLSNALLSEAKQAADEVEAAVKRMDKIARARTRKSVDQDYLEQAHALLEAVDLKQRSQKSIDRQGKWEAFAAAREAEGFDIVVPASFEATINRTHWSRLSVENLLALDETVKQVLHLGRLKQTLLDGQEEREWEAIYAEAEASADNIGRKPPKGSFTEPSWWDSIKSGAATMDAALLKMEQVFDWLDQGNISGVFNRIVFRPIAAAQAREQDMTRDYFARIHAALEKLPASAVRRWGDKVTLDLLDPATGLPAVFERKKLVAMALNWGNAGNRQRLADGYGWAEAGVERALMDNLSEAEWQFVQETWDIIDTLWPHIEAMERAINGAGPEKVEAVEIVTPFGTFRGGYYPAIYDSMLDYKAEEHAGRKTDLFEATYIRASTRASATKDRMEKVSRPVLLDVGVINRHLGEVIHDVTHREPVMQAHKFLTSRRVMKAVDETLGPEVRKQFRPWLQHVANSWAQDRAGNEGLGKFMSKARANATVVGMGWRFTTMLTQVAGYSNSFEKVGATWVTAAIAQTSAHPIETFDFVMSRSGEMRGRMDTIDRDIRAEMTRMGSRVGAAANRLTDAKRFAFHGIGYMDRVVSIPTWLGAYNKALAEGRTEEEAVYAGDKAIRLSQGAAGPKDLAAVATGQGRFGEAFKWLTMFYSYLSTVYSRQRNLGRDVRRASVTDLPGLMARAWWLIVVPPLLAEILSGRGPDDDEDAAWWAFKRMVSQSVGAIPGVRDIAEPVFAGLTGDFSFGYRLSPVQAGGESVVKVAKDAGRIYRGEETKRATRDVMEMAGYFTGLVPGQLAASTQFLVDVGHGEADPEGFAQWYEGLTKGKMSEK
jgi:hypothetical protein